MKHGAFEELGMALQKLCEEVNKEISKIILPILLFLNKKIKSLGSKRKENE